MGLLDKRTAVRQEQYVGYGSASAQNIHKTRRSPCLAGSRGHDHEMLAHAVHDLCADRTYGLLLIVTVRDLIAYRDGEQVRLDRTAIHQTLEVRTAEDPADASLRSGEVVPEIGLETVGSEHHRSAFEPAFETIRIEHGLRHTHVRIDTRLLGLDDRERKAIFTE